jgi:ferritin
MLSKKLQSALNHQIAEEAYASNYYLAMASWCDKEGLHGSANFLYTQAEQERAHMMKLFRYVNDTGGHAVAPAVKEAPQEFKNLSNVFELTLKHELVVTKLINALVETCLEEKDYSTFNFLQWYVAEQHEEERLLKNILDLIRITGTDGRGIFHIDKEVGSRFLEGAKKG